MEPEGPIQFPTLYYASGAMEPTKQFRQCVRDALVNLYDPAHMEVHPLVKILALDGTPARTGARVLRESLIDAIELLQPKAGVPYGDPAWIGYRILRERYIEAAHPREVCANLGLSRTTFYRYHREALDALIHIVWRQLAPDTRGRSVDIELPLSNEDAVDEALRVARSSQAQRLDVIAFMRDMRDMLGLVAGQAGGEITIEMPETLPSIACNGAVLRQIILNLVSEAFRLAPGASTVMTLYAEGDAVKWCLTGSTLTSLGSELSSTTGVGISHALLEIYKGSLRFERETRNGLAGICFQVPVAPSHVVLVVDDNPDLAALYSRYLTERDCIVYQAHSARDVDSWLMRIRPDLVLLDILMPDEDGWLILRKLKEDPDTAGIPVVICSVLDQPDLAIALGAEAVLQKPVVQEDLLSLVDALMVPLQA